MTIASTTKEKTITAENQFTDTIKTGRGGPAIVSVIGTFSATVTIMVRPNGATNWIEVQTITTPEYWTESDPLLDAELKAGVKTGDYTSGSPIVVVSG